MRRILALAKWITEPFRDMEAKNKVSNELIISKVREKKEQSFRPNNFDEYIGQEKAKNILKAYISCAKNSNQAMPHILIFGGAGCGKTTLARILARELNVTFEKVVASDILSSMDVLSYLMKLQKHGILFVDEVNVLPREAVEGCYSIIEYGKYQNLTIAPFTFIGATTELDEISKDRRPFYDKFKIVELEPYTNEEIEKIIRQYKLKVFQFDNISEDSYKAIAENSKGTPEKAIRLLESEVYLKNDIKNIPDKYTNNLQEKIGFSTMNNNTNTKVNLAVGFISLVIILFVIIYLSTNSINHSSGSSRSIYPDYDESITLKSNYVIAPSEELFHKMQDVLATHDRAAFTQMMSTGQAGCTQDGTEAYYEGLGSSIGIAKVRLKGSTETMYTNIEAVKRK